MNDRHFRIFLVFVVLIFSKAGVNAMRIPEEVKDVVVFIYIKNANGHWGQVFHYYS